MAGATAFIRQAAVVSFNHLDLFGGDQAIRKLPGLFDLDKFVFLFMDDPGA